MARSCLVYAPHLTPRLTYTFDFLLSHCFGQPVRYTRQPQDLQSTAHVRVNYSDDPALPADCHIPPAGLLFESGIESARPEWHLRAAKPGLFPVPVHSGSWPFDVASATFYLLSRYEEYQPFTADAHGRFPAAAGIMTQHGVLQRPLINEWIQELRLFFQKREMPLTAPRPTYRFLPTYDVDLAWAYRHRPWWRQLAAFTRDSFRWDWYGLQERLQVLSGQKKDPYDTFQWLDELHQHKHITAVYFWLMGRYNQYDRNISPAHPAYRQLFQHVCTDAACGLHPSYASNHRPERLAEESRAFASLQGQPPRRSRQHFLMLRFPTTYRALIQAGIYHDYTLGFPELPGFRAGYGGTFPWYDLEKEEKTDLLLTPFTVMDGTLFRYMSLTAKEALPILRELISSCRQNNAQLVSLWHNSSFYEREGWSGMRTLYKSFLAEASDKTQF